MLRKALNEQQPRQKNLLSGVQKRIYTYAAFAVLTIMLTVVLVVAATTAWYTNVAKTSNLVFEAASWGFQGEVELEDENTMEIAPGEGGIVPLSFKNTSSEVIRAGVNISKELMDEDMKKRIYFYVDTPSTVNGEVVERTYLNSSGSYSYTILPNDTLALNSGSYNGAPVKWEWVYDVLGYYFEGTYDEAQKKMNIEEYLRPVIYDYDQATFEVPEGSSEEKWLATVDGTKTVVEFIKELTEADGYPGVRDFSEEADFVPHSYIQIDVDGEGHGVWLYLCTWAEIEMASVVDTNRGLAAASNKPFDPATARISIFGQQEQLIKTTVSTSQDLARALAEGNADIVFLDSDIFVSDVVRMTEGQQAILDLNGNTMTYDGSGVLFQLEKGSDLTIIGGENSTLNVREHSDFTAEAIQVRNSSLTIQGVTVSNADSVIAVRDQMEKGQDSLIRLKDCSLDSRTNCGVLLLGNGTGTEQKTRLIIENSHVYGKYAAVSGNGSTTGVGCWGTDIQIIGSTLSGGWAAVYQPQRESTLFIRDSILTGYTGLVVKGGYVRITDSTIEGTGENPSKPAFSGGGFTDTGDGVYVETNYTWDKTVEISGSCKVTSAHGKAVRQYAEKAENTRIVITGGTFDSDVSEFVPAGYVSKRNGEVFTVEKEK